MKWTSINEQLPVVQGYYLTKSLNTVEHVTWFDLPSKAWSLTGRPDMKNSTVDVDWWMELPEPPEKE